MLDQIVSENPDRVAPVQWHANSSFPMYRQEAWDKWHLYPPPMSGTYYYPWLWVDGRNRGFDFYQWRDYIVQQIAVPTDIRLTHAGTFYDPGTRSGEIRIECYNDGDTLISAALQVVLTEDSIRYVSSNGDTWHNHVCRDYIPTHLGTSVTLPAGGTDTLVVPFVLDTAYNENRCKIVAWLQNMTLQPDSSLPCYQGLATDLLSLVGVEDDRPVAAHLPPLSASIVRGVLCLPAASSFKPQASSSLLDISGRKALDLKPGPNDLRPLAPGVYFVRTAIGVHPSAVTRVLLAR